METPYQGCAHLLLARCSGEHARKLQANRVKIGRLTGSNDPKYHKIAVSIGSSKVTRSALNSCDFQDCTVVVGTLRRLRIKLVFGYFGIRHYRGANRRTQPPSFKKRFLICRPLSGILLESWRHSMLINPVYIGPIPLKVTPGPLAAECRI